MASARRRRRQPSSPEEIAARKQAEVLRQAELRAAGRASAADPATWGINPGQAHLAAFGAVAPASPGRGRYRPPRRLDAFAALHAAGGLDDGQLGAIERLMQTWRERMGIQEGRDHLCMEPSGGAGDQELVNDRMLAAREKLEQILTLVGRADAILLSRLIEIAVLEADAVTTWWRGCVQRVTGEAERHCQGAAVRRAVENLRMAWGDYDAGYRTPRDMVRRLGPL